MRGMIDGSNLMFAGGAALWGVVTVYQCVRGWKEEQPLPLAMVAGMVTSVGSIAYLIWTLLAS